MMRRDVASAAAIRYDLIVIGGGIHGACLTLEAARRGLRTLLLERDDFGGATSWNSLRIIHGGLRYLQRLDVARYREAVAERRWFLRHFPDQVAPLECLMPLYGHGLRRPFVLAAALALDDQLSGKRNDGVRPDRRLDAGATVGADEALACYPGIETSGLLGAARWNDAYMPHAPRVLIEILRWAAAAGARALNYVEATDLRLSESGRVAGVTAVDRESGRSYEVEAPRIANCAGPWCRELSTTLDRDVPELFHPTLAMNLLLDRQPPSRMALAVSPPGQDRSYFLVPWRNRLMAGTWYGPDREADGPDDPVALEFARDLDAAAPGLGLADARILRVFTGRLPAGDAAAEPASRPVIVDHARHGGPEGLVSVSGVKYTTARSLAAATLRALCGGLPPRGEGSRPEPARWPTAIELEDASADPAALADRLRKLAEDEAVVRLEDLTLRRTDLGLDPEDGAGAVEKVARLLALEPTRGAPA